MVGWQKAVRRNRACRKKLVDGRRNRWMERSVELYWDLDGSGERG